AAGPARRERLCTFSASARSVSYRFNGRPPAGLWHECGGWRWTNRQLEPPQRNGWTFPLGSSGPLRSAPLAVQLRRDSERLSDVSRKAQRRRGISFWSDTGDSFWADFHARLPTAR